MSLILEFWYTHNIYNKTYMYTVQAVSLDKSKGKHIINR